MHPDDSNRSTLLAALAIVLVGIVLGLGYNALGLASRPPRGLAWVGGQAPLQSLEALTDPLGADTSAAGPADTGAVAPASPGGAGATAQPPAPGAAGPGVAARPQRGPDTPVSSPARKQNPGGSVRPQTEAPGPMPAQPAGLPPIPESREPLEVQVALARRFHEAGAAVFVDARERPEYAAGHIAGAISLPLDEAAADPARIAPLKQAGKPVIVYCGGGDCELSRSLAYNLLDAGLRRVLVFTGGMSDWQAAGHPVRSGDAP